MENMEMNIWYTQRNELIKTTKRVLLSIFLVYYAKFLVEVRKRFCCVKEKNIVNIFYKIS